MLQRIAYRYHRLFGLMFITIIGTGLIKIDFSKIQTGKTNSSTMQKVESDLSSIKNANAWLNSPPLTARELKGKVVVIQFCTYTCINWLRTLPYVRAWSGKYKDKGLVIIGVHTPEFPFEKNMDNVRESISDMKIDFPIAVDNNQDIWNAFGNQYWPALYFIDAKGRIRDSHFGEGDYERSEKIIQELLVEAGAKDVNHDLASIDAHGVEVAADWSNLNSPENYLGYQRTENFSSRRSKAFDKNHTYLLPSNLRLNHWALAGDWTVKKQSIVLNGAGGKIVYRFHARDLHLVMGPASPGTTVRFRVTIDGRPPETSHGTDIDEQGNGTVKEQRMYQLIRQPLPIVDREIVIEFIDTGSEGFAFTFG